MPMYVYEIINEDGSPGERFEVLQSFSDEPLTQHPETGQPVRKVITAGRIAGKWSESGMGQNLSNKRLNELGFTKYEKAGDGYYEKKSGQGPDVIQRD